MNTTPDAYLCWASGYQVTPENSTCRAGKPTALGGGGAEVLVYSTINYGLPRLRPRIQPSSADCESHQTQRESELRFIPNFWSQCPWMQSSLSLFQWLFVRCTLGHMIGVGQDSLGVFAVISLVPAAALSNRSTNLIHIVRGLPWLPEESGWHQRWMLVSPIEVKNRSLGFGWCRRKNIYMAGLEAALEENQNDWLLGNKDVRILLGLPWTTGEIIIPYTQGTRCGTMGLISHLVCLWCIWGFIIRLTSYQKLKARIGTITIIFFIGVNRSHWHGKMDY